MSRRIAIVTIVVVSAAIAMAGGCGGASKTVQAASPSPSFTPPPAWVMAIATKQVRSSDAHPIYAGWTLATLAELAPAFGGNPFKDYPASKRHTKVYLVVLHGDFTNVPILGWLSSSPPPVIH